MAALALAQEPGIAPRIGIRARQRMLQVIQEARGILGANHLPGTLLFRVIGFNQVREVPRQEEGEFFLFARQQLNLVAKATHRHAPAQARLALESFDARQMTEAIEELGCDVERWLVLLTTPRVPEAKALLRQIDHWVLLTTCDHDGVVSSYRMLKGMADLGRPRLTLAVLDAGGAPRDLLELAGSDEPEAFIERLRSRTVELQGRERRADGCKTLAGLGQPRPQLPGGRCGLPKGLPQ